MLRCGPSIWDMLNPAEAKGFGGSRSCRSQLLAIPSRVKHPKTSPWCFSRLSSSKYPSGCAPTCSLQVKGALDSDTVKGSWDKPWKLGTCMKLCASRGWEHPIFLSRFNGESSSVPGYLRKKNSGVEFPQHFKGIEGAGNERSSHHFCTLRHGLSTAPSALPDLPSHYGLPLEGQETKSRIEMVPARLGQVFPDCST